MTEWIPQQPRATAVTDFPARLSVTVSGCISGSRFSYRDIEELMAERGVTVTYETIRAWCYKFGKDYAMRIRARRGRLGDTWHLDEVYLKIDGRLQYLWRAVDQDGSVLDILVQPHRDKKAAARFSRNYCEV